MAAAKGVGWLPGAMNGGSPDMRRSKALRTNRSRPRLRTSCGGNEDVTSRKGSADLKEGVHGQVALQVGALELVDEVGQR